MVGDALTHGWSGLVAAYATVQVPMLAAMVRGRAQLHKYLIAPTVAAPLTLMTGIGMSVLNPVLQSIGLEAHSALQWALGATLGAGLGYSGGRVLAEAAPQNPTHQRGTVLVETPPAARADRERFASRQARAREVTFAGLPVPPADEAKHFKLIGTTGTGKTTAIGELLSGALARGDRAVIADPDGGYLQRFYSESRGDVILNPFEQRSVKWDLFAEIETAYDVEQLARSLIPDHEGSDRIWSAYARTFFCAVTGQAQEAGIRDVGELYRLLVAADTSELRTLVEGTPAQPFLDQHNSRMFDSIRSVTSASVASLRYVATQNAPSQSVRRWVSSEQPGVLFMPYKAGQIAALRGSISGWMRLAIFEAMNRDDTGQRGDRGAANRRLWFVVDELDALGQIDGLKDALVRLRKFDGRCVLGFQSIAQVSSTYGHGDAHTLVENCGNTLLLRCSASEGGGTARFASQLVGEREVARTTISTTRRFGEWAGSKTHSQHVSVEPALLPSQIEQLQDFVGYLKFASDPTWRRVQLSRTAARADRPVTGTAADVAAGASAGAGGSGGASASAGRRSDPSARPAGRTGWGRE
jgi:hypothetical protein